MLSTEFDCISCLQAAIEGLTSSHLEKTIEEMRALPKLGASPGSCTKSFLQSVGQASQLDQVPTKSSV